MITLKSSCLRVEIAEPGEHPNDGVRFDRAGFITDVILNNERHFCANEPKNLAHPSTGGRGLCCELKLDLSQAAQSGQRYPKLGVGLIRKDGDAPYLFYGKYDVTHFPIEYGISGSSAEFVTSPLPCMGYAVRQRKLVSVEGNALTVECKLENVGEKPLSIVEYCHNFLSIDGMAISPDYTLELPSLPDLDSRPMTGPDGQPLNLTGCGRGFTFAKADLAVALCSVDISGMAQISPNRWRLSHKGAKAHIDGEDSYIPSGLTIWAADHMMSPEFLHDVRLAPGETAQWTRRLSFTDEIYE